MKVYGADFSGAMNPSKSIYYAEGLLDNNKLLIERVVHCDDRLDLLAAIHFSKAPWGLDFPFSIPVKALNQMKMNSWVELLENVVGFKRSDFDPLGSKSTDISFEVRCQQSSICCRSVDASTNAFSPLKRYVPNMLMMTYAGLKLLSYLRKFGNVVYPFDHFNNSVSRLYEIYPSHTWRQTGLCRKLYIKEFFEIFQDKYNFKVEISDHLLPLKTLDAADAVIACVTLAYALDKNKFEADWDKKHSWYSDDEWKNRHLEGLIVKMH